MQRICRKVSCSGIHVYVAETSAPQDTAARGGRNSSEPVIAEVSEAPQPARRGVAVIQPVVEFFPLEPTLSKGGVNLELFPTSSRAHRYNRELRKALDSPTARGIYVFYGTRGRALYVGKATRQSLWRESCSALNRPRRTQQVLLVNHPRGPSVSFVPPEERARQIKKTHTELSKLASYISAYNVDQKHISDIEALLIRAFANDLLNSQMAKFKQQR